MKNNGFITSALGNVDDKYLLEAMPKKQKRERATSINFRLIATVAACVVVGVACWLTILMFGGKSDHAQTPPPSGTPGHYEGDQGIPDHIDFSKFDFLEDVDKVYLTTPKCFSETVTNHASVMQLVWRLFDISADIDPSVTTPEGTGSGYHMDFAKDGQMIFGVWIFGDHLVYFNEYDYPSCVYKVADAEKLSWLISDLDRYSEGLLMYCEEKNQPDLCWGIFTMTFDTDGYSYSPGVESSYVGFGTWKRDGDYVIIGGVDSSEVGYFRIDGDDLVFEKDRSSGQITLELEDGQTLYLVHGQVPENEINEDISERLY